MQRSLLHADEVKQSGQMSTICNTDDTKTYQLLLLHVDATISIETLESYDESQK